MGLAKSRASFLSLPPHIFQNYTRYYQPSLDTGIFPDDWKKAKVSPVCKVNARNAPDNYRPISILPAIFKVIERIVHSQVLEFFTENNLLSLRTSRYAFNLHGTAVCDGFMASETPTKAY